MVPRICIIYSSIGGLLFNLFGMSVHAAFALFSWYSTRKWEQIMMVPGTCVIYPSIEGAIDTPFRSVSSFVLLLHDGVGIHVISPLDRGGAYCHRYLSYLCTCSCSVYTFT